MDRGVYHQEYNGPGDTEVLIAVDRVGCALVRAFVPADAHRKTVVRRLHALLAALDPAGQEEDRQACERRRELELIE